MRTYNIVLPLNDWRAIYTDLKNCNELLTPETINEHCLKDNSIALLGKLFNKLIDFENKKHAGKIKQSNPSISVRINLNEYTTLVHILQKIKNVSNSQFYTCYIENMTEQLHRFLISNSIVFNYKIKI